MKSLITVILCALIANFCSAATTTYTATEGGRTWSYTLDSSGNATLTAVDNALGDLALPTSLDGHTVTAVGEWTFSGNTAITALEIPDSVMTLGSGAFANCTGLASVKIGNGVTDICGAPENQRLSNCPGEYNFTNYGCFYGCTSLTNIVFGSGVKTIARGAFYGCMGLAKVTIPDNVTTIGAYAFDACTKLRSLNIGSCVTST